LDLSLGTGQEENVGERIENETEPKPSPRIVAGVQSAVRAEGGKNEPE
jgi:hypothetical protein